MLGARWFSLLVGVAATCLGSPARADCAAPNAPCVDAEPLWQSSSARRLLIVADAPTLPRGAVALGLSTGFRYRPAVLTVPSPNQTGRDINLVRSSLDAEIAARFGLWRRWELTASLPAGLDQRGAGIKGATAQQAPPIARAALHDGRIGFGVELPAPPRLLAKVRFEAKLPLGSSESLAGERSAVASPSVALSSRGGGFFWGAELGARLRRPSELFGLRLGSQAVLAVGAGYALPRPQLSFAVETYLAGSLIPSGVTRFMAAEWLSSARFAPQHSPWSLGLGGGSGLPVSGSGSFAFGVPALRLLAFVRYVPESEP